MEADPETLVGQTRSLHVHEIDWDAYASQYDLLAANNPSYHENIRLLRRFLLEVPLPKAARVCDVGAGTGNFICAIAKDVPDARFVHLDADHRMNSVAESKYAAAGVRNVEIHCCPAEEATFPIATFDLIVCVNALYAIQAREEVLRRIHSWLKPGGSFFAIDFGRKTRMWDWAKYIFGSIYRQKGLVECIRFFFNGLETIRQNRRGAQGQEEGVYWLHTTDEFVESLQSAGFEVKRVQSCYRGYCDLAICQLADK